MSIDLSKLITAEMKLEQAKVSKIAQLSAECEAAILSDFECGALGQVHTYPSKEKDQLNLASSVTDSLLLNLEPDWTTPFWCADEAGEWAMRKHTAMQIQQVGREAKARILRLMQRNVELGELVRLAPDIKALEQITWKEPTA